MDEEPTYPLAYFITFTCYGTWLHGDPRGAVRRRTSSVGDPREGPSTLSQQIEWTRLENAPPHLGARERGVVHRTTHEVCDHRGWKLLALNVRTNHVHFVAAAQCHPDRVMQDVKAYSTRRLVEAGLIDRGSKVWTTHGSTRWLWKERHVVAACDYVLNRQGPDLPMV